MGESIGKDGNGMTPTVSIGSTDLHSVAQLYLGGPHDKITTLIYGENQKYDITLPTEGTFNLVENLNGKKVPQIMHAIVQGTKIAYQNQHIPFMEISFDTVSEGSMGEYLQFAMLQMMYLGKLMGVNTFDQPHVELYKAETRKILKG
jgi:glucose-6-phosphate isomerase